MLRDCSQGCPSGGPWRTPELQPMSVRQSSFGLRVLGPPWTHRQIVFALQAHH